MLKDLIKSEDDVKLEQLYDALEDIYNKIMLVLLHKLYGVQAELVGEDKISIDGVVMDEEEFADWLNDQDIDLMELQPNPNKRYDA